MHYDVAIIGAGAAGLMCALQAGARGRRTLLLDHNSKVGAKILVSGGGRCNFTNINTTSQQFVSQNEHFCKSALARYLPENFISLVEKHRIAFHEKKLGQLFCDRSSREIVNMLERECELVGAEIRLGVKISKVAQKIQLRSVGPQYRYELDLGSESVTCESLVIATGGLSIASLGASDFGYRIARQFAIKIVEPHPALDGFVFKSDTSEARMMKNLAGVSIDCVVNCRGQRFRENILFTHKGLSGPAALQASLYWRAGDEIYINLIPDVDALTFFAAKKKEKSLAQFKTLLGTLLPTRFVDHFCEGNIQFQAPISEIADRAIAAWVGQLQQWCLRPTGTVGYSKAEVTRGGVDTNELSSKNLEAKNHPGLYFIGEVVDVTGWLGGYNFQWAWASGWAAAQTC